RFAAPLNSGVRRLQIEAIMRLTILLLLLSSVLAACHDDDRIERMGRLNCQLVLVTEPRLTSGFVEDALVVGERLGLERAADPDTEAAFSERTHPVHIKYLVKQTEDEKGLVALITNAPA